VTARPSETSRDSDRCCTVALSSEVHRGRGDLLRRTHRRRYSRRSRSARPRSRRSANVAKPSPLGRRRTLLPHDGRTHSRSKACDIALSPCHLPKGFIHDVDRRAYRANAASSRMTKSNLALSDTRDVPWSRAGPGLRRSHRRRRGCRRGCIRSLTFPAQTPEAQSFYRLLTPVVTTPATDHLGRLSPDSGDPLRARRRC
jgi:hypothetical protein